MKRWLKFNAVGAGGIVVQLGVLTLLTGVFKVNYLVATALAVEAAILHNFFWHQRFTWRDCPRLNRWWQLLKFNFTTGLISILGNLAVMEVLVARFHLNYLLSNAVSIAACSIGNFLASDLFVFPNGGCGEWHRRGGS